MKGTEKSKTKYITYKYFTKLLRCEKTILCKPVGLT